MTARKSRQRGHGSWGFLGWLITWMPWVLGGLGAVFVALIVWAFWRLCK